jgi:hypothetical protein
VLFLATIMIADVISYFLEKRRQQSENRLQGLVISTARPFFPAAKTN